LRSGILQRSAGNQHENYRAANGFFGKCFHINKMADILISSSTVNALPFVPVFATADKEWRSPIGQGLHSKALEIVRSKINGSFSTSLAFECLQRKKQSKNREISRAAVQGLSSIKILHEKLTPASI
jgi:hypothetical protein